MSMLQLIDGYYVIECDCGVMPANTAARDHKVSSQDLMHWALKRWEINSNSFERDSLSKRSNGFRITIG